MIISHGRKYIFIHIPKTGGTAMALALEDRAMKDDIMVGDTPKALKRRTRVKGAKTAGRLWKHSTLADIDGLVSAEEIADYFVFTLVRNPWDRMVSYYHWLREQDFDHAAVALARELPFSQFVTHRHTQASFRAAPYGYYVDGAKTQNFIRLEHFVQDAAPLWAHLGFELDLPKFNSSKRREDYRSYYGEADRNAVAHVCASDIARFGYEF